MGITINQPQPNQKVLLGQSVDFAGTVALGTRDVQLDTDDGIRLPSVTLRNKEWFVSHRFQKAGTHTVVARALDSNGNELGRAKVEVKATASPAVAATDDFGALVPIPTGINPGVTAAQQDTMVRIFGKPCSLKADCTAVTNDKVKQLLVTKNVGPFTVTGIRPVVEALTRIFKKVKEEKPELHRVLGTAGVLCCRRVRRESGPPSPNFSNHSWGTAIDLKIKGALDPRGDGKTQKGILLLAPYFNEERFFWGAGFRGRSEDAMHFEASDKLVREWSDDGLLD
jgi:hypothetical protein